MAARQWAIHVKTLAGEELTTLQLQQDIFQTPVAELVQAACEKIGNYYCSLLHACTMSCFNI